MFEAPNANLVGTGPIPQAIEKSINLLWQEV